MTCSAKTPPHTGTVLIAALQESPYREIDIEPRRERLPVRDMWQESDRAEPGAEERG
jgi:hypothetical protein